MWPCGHIELKVLISYFNLRDVLSFSFSWWLFSVWSGNDEKHPNLGTVSSNFYLEMLKVMSSAQNDLLCTLANRGTRSHHGTSHSGLIYSQVSFDCWEKLYRYLFLWCLFLLNMQVSIASNSTGPTCQVPNILELTYIFMKRIMGVSFSPEIIGNHCFTYWTSQQWGFGIAISAFAVVDLLFLLRWNTYAFHEATEDSCNNASFDSHHRVHRPKYSLHTLRATTLHRYLSIMN